MNAISFTTLERGKATVDAASLQALSAQIRGTVLREGDAAYDEVRGIWNGMIDRRPGLIVCCVGASDVVIAVNFARENRLLVCVRGGGHNIDVDRETQAFGLALPTGINSTTGIAGLTLGGGFGWITRKFGLTIDNLVSADVVTADGKLLRASQSENPDLFWALR
ncbi:MAG: FAD-dependent oxidoreductase, partial [Mesorhizobium sp.]